MSNANGNANGNGNGNNNSCDPTYFLPGTYSQRIALTGRDLSHFLRVKRSS